MSGPNIDFENEPRNRWFEAWGRGVVRFRWLMLLFSAGLMFGAPMISKDRLVVDTSVESFSVKDSSAQTALDEYRDEFGKDEMFMIVASGDVFSLPYLKRLKALHDELAVIDLELESLGYRNTDFVRMKRAQALGEQTELETKEEAEASDQDDAGFDDADEFEDDAGEDAWADESGGTIVEKITSLINVRQTRMKAGVLEIGELMKPFPTADSLAALKKQVLSNRTLVNQVVSRSGEHSVILVRTQFMSDEDSKTLYTTIKGIADTHKAEGFDLTVAGLPALHAELNDVMLGDLRTMLMASVSIMFLLLLILFRNPIAVVAPLAVVAVSAVTTVASMALGGFAMTMLTNILPAFLFVVGVGHSIHLISVYRDGLAGGMDSKDAVVFSLATTGVPIFYTSLTTMVGLMSFGFADLEAIREMGFAGAYGVGVVFVLSITLLPAALSFNRTHPMGRRASGEPDFLDGFLNLCVSASGLVGDSGRGPEPQKARRRRHRALVALVVVTVIGVTGANMLRVYHNPLSWLPDTMEIKRSFDLVDSELGGSAAVQILVDGTPEKGMRDIELMKALEKFEAHVMAFDDPEGKGLTIGHSMGVLDVVKETHQAFNGDTAGAYRLPETERGISDMLFMFESAGPQELRQLATTDLSRSQMTFRTRFIDATSYQPLADHLAAGIEKYIPEGRSVRPTGTIYTLLSTIGSLVWDLMRSFGLAFIVITMIMIILLRGFRLGIIAMVPNLLPIVMIMGVMGVGDIPIDMSTILISSISIGVAVDDTIHLLHHYRVNLAATGNVETSIQRAMSHSGRAMVTTSLILVLGFAAYLAASVANIQRFGLLVSLTAILALLIDLIFAPALLRTFYGRLPSDGEENEDASEHAQLV